MSFDLKVEVTDFYKASIILARRAAYPLGRFYDISEGDIEEAVQETYLLICRRWESFRRKDTAMRLASLRCIVKNKILSAHRNNSRYRHRFRPLDELPDQADGATDIEQDHQQRAEARDRLKQVQKALPQLQPDHQEVLGLLLTTVDQGPQRFTHIAEVMGRSEAAIRSLCYRAIRALKRAMDGGAGLDGEEVGDEHP